MTLATETYAQTAFEDSPPVLVAAREPSLLARETLAGIMTALALIPEVISFSFVSGVDPKTALVASVVLCFAMSVLGGRPAMVTAAAGSIALVIGPMVKAHGVGYILPTLMLAGLVQIGFGLGGLAKLMRFIPRPVMTGFVNALGILIFSAQVPHIVNVPWLVYPLFALTIAIVLILPRVTSAVPGPLVAIVVVTAIVMVGGFAVPNVGGDGTMASGLPGLTPWVVPFNAETLWIIGPTALSVAFVGLLETLLTAELVDELTDTRSHKGRESWGLGVANILAGLYGGIGGCAMIGQTVVNVKIGCARTRISTAVTALVLLVLLTALNNIMAQIPLVALAAVMMIVALKTIDWQSVKPAAVRRLPVTETSAMLVTVAVTVATGNLAFGVAAGVALATVAKLLRFVVS
jgi:sulfate permease, SulP family